MSTEDQIKAKVIYKCARKLVHKFILDHTKDLDHGIKMLGSRVSTTTKFKSRQVINTPMHANPKVFLFFFGGGEGRGRCFALFCFVCLFVFGNRQLNSSYFTWFNKSHSSST